MKTPQINSPITMSIPVEILCGTKLFKNVDEAKKVVKGWNKNEYNINIDPKGSGWCFIEILDPETGEIDGVL